MYSPQPTKRLGQKRMRAAGHKTYAFVLCSPPLAQKELKRESKYVIADALA
jgi:hypothetical protein